MWQGDWYQRRLDVFHFGARCARQVAPFYFTRALTSLHLHCATTTSSPSPFRRRSSLARTTQLQQDRNSRVQLERARFRLPCSSGDSAKHPIRPFAAGFHARRASRIDGLRLRWRPPTDSSSALCETPRLPWPTNRPHRRPSITCNAHKSRLRSVNTPTRAVGGSERVRHSQRERAWSTILQETRRSS